MAVIILVRRVARADQEDAFLKKYDDERPKGRKGFITEYLTRVEGADLPGLRELGLAHPGSDGIAYLNVAFWESEQDFVDAFNPTTDYYDKAIECEPRKRAVLRVRDMAGSLPPKVE